MNDESRPAGPKGRGALLRAFGKLVLEQPFEEIRVAQITAQAGVARSTFYQHYRNKADLLVDATAHLFRVLADCVNGIDPRALVRVLAHFQENRAMASAVLEDPAARALLSHLTDQIEARMASRTPEGRLTALQVAGGQLELVRAWLSGRVRATPEELAAALMQFTRAAVS